MSYLISVSQTVVPKTILHSLSYFTLYISMGHTVEISQEILINYLGVFKIILLKLRVCVCVCVL